MMTRRAISLSVGGLALAAGLATALAVNAEPPSSVTRFLADRDLYSISLVRGDYPVWMELPELSSPETSSKQDSGEVPADDLIEPELAAMEEAVDVGERPEMANVGNSTGRMVAPLKFSVTDFGMAASVDVSGKIRTSKPVMLAGNRLGTIELAVGQGASVSIDRQSLADLVGDRSPALASTLTRLEGDRVTLEEIRSREVAVRYDPLADALIIEPRS